MDILYGLWFLATIIMTIVVLGSSPPMLINLVKNTFVFLLIWLSIVVTGIAWRLFKGD